MSSSQFFLVVKPSRHSANGRRNGKVNFTTVNLGKLLRLEDGEKRKRVAALYANGNTLDVGMTQSPNERLTGDHVVGLDVVVPAHLPKNYSRFIQGDCTHLNAVLQGETFDTIIALEVIEQLPDWVEFFRQAHECLNLNGKFIVSTPSPVLWRTVWRMAFFQKEYPLSGRGVDENSVKPWYGHERLHQPRILNAVAQELGFKLLEVRNSSESCLLPFLQKNLLFAYVKH